MKDWTDRALSADEAVSRIASGMHVFLHGAAATPTPLVEALSRRRELSNVSLYHLHTTGPAPFADPEHEGRFLSVSLFAGPPVRAAIGEGRADFIPVFLSDIPRLFLDRAIPLDCSLRQRGADFAGASGFQRRAAARICGDATLHHLRGCRGCWRVLHGAGAARCPSRRGAAEAPCSTS